MDSHFRVWPAADSDRPVSLMLVTGAHLMMIAWLYSHPLQPELSLSLPTMTGVLVAPPVPEPVVAPPKPKPLPPRPRPVPRIKQAPPAEHAITLPAEPEPPPPPSAPMAAAQAEPGPAPVIPPRSDAAHLNNPAPAYPPLSRRLGEQGRVLFDVYILADGTVGEIRLKASSGFSRLDAAAREAVKRWRYVPARRGDVAIAYWYVQPVSFSLHPSQPQ
ncbi:MAG: hypothetical protein FD165_1679 [Gammaproteobacteria bacterium]|nr:MAG: hypothetical protein FD165_1679 [Gammaproteobacteria bacterium]TND02673.1 MAG: hypothetical protein FD120_2134 [Gammaproteobacteria bacterium]